MGEIMSRKPFSSYDHKTNDPITKRIAVRFLEQGGEFELQCPLDDQPERFGDWDFFIFSQALNRNMFVEVQRKHGWKDYGKWQHNFRTVHVEERKHKSRAELFIMFNYHCNTLLIGSMKKIIEAKVIKKDCRLSDGSILEDDHFYELPPESFDFYKLDGYGVWRTTKP